MCYTEKQIIGGDLIELRVLRYFLTVAQEENISHAAGILHVTQPTLSRQLADLEYELGVKLFHRGNRRITLTEPVELSRYEFLRLRERDRWGVITYEGSPLAAKETVTIDDLKGLPLMLSRRAEVQKNLAYWFGEQTDSLHIFATYNLIGNAAGITGTVPRVCIGVCRYTLSVHLLPPLVSRADYILCTGLETAPALQRGGTPLYPRNNDSFQ